jgi:8-oxo-dGTP pyrophosphatase MutT (NUDIX family)
MGEARVEVIPDDRQDARSWALEIDGEPYVHVGKLTLSSRYAVLEYGLTPAGYDGCRWREPGGGGVVVLPWTTISGLLHVGVLRQQRPFQGGLVLNAPRGFVDPGESHESAALRELLEETGYDPDDRLVALGGEPANPNSAFFDTSIPDSGVRFFGVEIDPTEVMITDNRVTLRDDTGPLDADEGIEGLEFVPWTEAARLADMFTNAGVARLIAFVSSDPAVAHRA